MALTTPILQQMAAFDATQAATFTFSVPTSGDQVTGNKLTIIQQSSGSVVYQATQTTFNYVHTLPANTLINTVGTGTIPTNYYTAYIQTINASSALSSNSNSISFYCYSTPTLVFSNIPTGNIISNSAYSFNMTYSQAQGELLSSYEYNLYNSSNVLIGTSGVLYVGSSTAPPTTVSYLFSELQDNTSYYIEGIGETINGTQISTGTVQISIVYEAASTYFSISATQNCDGGYVTIASNLTNIVGTSYPSPPSYVGGNSVDLTTSGYYVNWGNSQIDISGDFTLQVWGKNFIENSNIVVMQNSILGKITIRYCAINSTSASSVWNGESSSAVWDSTSSLTWGSEFVYAECIVENGESYYIYTDNISSPLSSDTIQIWLRRINGIYQIGIYNLQ